MSISHNEFISMRGTRRPFFVVSSIRLSQNLPSWNEPGAQR